MEGGNHMYKLVKGATTLNENEFNHYELSFKLKTPKVIADDATFYVFDRLNSGGSGGRIGYRKYANGTSAWLLYNAAWAAVKQNTLPAPDLQPDTVYNMKVIVKGPEISVYVDNKLKLKASDATFNASGQVGFYAGVSVSSCLMTSNSRFLAGKYLVCCWVRAMSTWSRGTKAAASSI